jgi:hypothetical protein
MWMPREEFAHQLAIGALGVRRRGAEAEVDNALKVAQSLTIWKTYVRHDLEACYSCRGQPSPDTRRGPRVDEVAVETMPVSCETSLSETILPEKD